MKVIFLILNLLTDAEAIRNVLHSFFIAALVSVGVFFLVGTYQVLRHSFAPQHRDIIGRLNISRE